MLAPPLKVFVSVLLLSPFIVFSAYVARIAGQPRVIQLVQWATLGC
jgi:hypothetical protein